MSTLAFSGGHATTINRSSRVQTTSNRCLAIVLMTVVVLAPLPLGSVRPFFWGLTTLLVGMAGATYFLVQARSRYQARFALGSVALPLGAVALFSLYLAIQTVPFGGWTATGVNGESWSFATISVSPGMTVLTLVAYLGYGLLAYLLLQSAANDQRRSAMLAAITLAIVIYALIGLASLQLGDTILGLQKWTYLHVATGPFVNRNSFATLLAMGAVLALAQGADLLLSRTTETGARHGSAIALYLVAFGIISVTLLSTESRMGLLAMVCGSAAVALATLRWSARSRWALLVLGGALVFALLLVLVYGQGVIERLARTDVGFDSRAALFAQVWELIMQRPLTGYGGGAFAEAFTLVHREPVDPNLIWDRAHNSYLNLWTEAGLLFGTLPMLAIGWCGFTFLRSVLSSRRNLAAAAGGLGIVVVGAVHSLTDFSLEIHGVAVVFVALLAICTAGSLTGSIRP